MISLIRPLAHTLLVLAVLTLAGSPAIAAEHTELSPNIFGHATQKDDLDAMMIPRWDLGDGARRVHVDASHGMNLRPHLIGDAIKQTRSREDILFLIDWHEPSDNLATLMRRMGYFEIARYATSRLDLSIVYVAIDEKWARSQTVGEHRRPLDAEIRGLVNREELTHEELVKGLARMTASIPSTRWEIKQAAYDESSSKLSMRLVQYDAEGQDQGTRMALGFDLRAEHERKVQTRDDTRLALIIIIVLGGLFLFWLVRRRRANLVARRWEQERPEAICPMCGSSQLFKPLTEHARCDECDWKSTRGSLGKRRDLRLVRLSKLRDAIAGTRAALTHAYSADPRTRIGRMIHEYTRGWTKQLDACTMAQIHVETARNKAEEFLEMLPTHERHAGYIDQFEAILDREPRLDRANMERWREHVLALHDVMEMIELELELRVWAQATGINHGKGQEWEVSWGEEEE